MTNSAAMSWCSPGQELRDRNIESGREQFKRAQSDIPLTSLDRADICSVDPTQLREFFLREIVRRSECANVRRKH